MSGESEDDDVECDFVINGDDRHGYGYRCACGSRNLGCRYVTRAAVEEERDYHMGLKPRPEVLGPPEPPSSMISVRVTMKGWGTP